MLSSPCPYICPSPHSKVKRLLARISSVPLHVQVLRGALKLRGLLWISDILEPNALVVLVDDKCLIVHCISVRLHGLNELRIKGSMMSWLFFTQNYEFAMVFRSIFPKNTPGTKNLGQARSTELLRPSRSFGSAPGLAPWLRPQGLPEGALRSEPGAVTMTLVDCRVTSPE